MKSQDHCAVVLDVARELRGGVASSVKAIGGGVVLGAGVGVVEINYVRQRRPPNCDTLNGLILCFRMGDGAVYLVVEEYQAEEFEPGAGIQFGSVEELEGRGKLTDESARDMAEHSL